MSNHHYEDDPSKYQTDNVALAQAMINAEQAEQRANELKVEALAQAAKEEAIQRDIARGVELSVQNNQQLLAQRNGFSPNRVTRSQDVGMVAIPEIVADTPIRYNGIEVSAHKGCRTMETGQWSKAEYQKSLSTALAQKGYKAPFEDAAEARDDFGRTCHLTISARCVSYCACASFRRSTRSLLS